MGRPKLITLDSPRGKAFQEEYAKPGMSVERAAINAGMTRNNGYALARELGARGAKVGAVKEAPAETGAPKLKLPAGATPHDAARAQVEWLRERIAWATGGGAATEGEVAKLSAQLTSATRLLAKLIGATDLTEAQIMRSPYWTKIQRAIKKANKDPDFWVRFEAALAIEDGEG